MRSIIFFHSCFISTVIIAQQPPIDPHLSSFYPSGAVTKIVLAVDGGVTAWMFEDEATMSSSGGIIFRFDSAGVPIESYYPELTADCGSLDRHIDFTLRNDSVWSISRHQYVGGDQPVLFCLNTPSGNWGPSPPTGASTKMATDLLVTDSHVYICGSVDSNSTVSRQSIYALDLEGDLLWDTLYDPEQFATLTHMAHWNGKLMVAEPPNLHHISGSDGAIISTQQLYMGTGPGRARLHVVGTDLYWASLENSILHYGKLDSAGITTFASSTPADDLTGLAVDEQSRMWITCGATIGNIKVIDQNGTMVSTYHFGAQAHDVIFGNGWITIAGRLNTATTESFLISGPPQ